MYLYNTRASVESYKEAGLSCCSKARPVLSLSFLVMELQTFLKCFEFVSYQITLFVITEQTHTPHLIKSLPFALKQLFT